MTWDSPIAEQLRGRARSAMPGGITRSTLYVAPHPPYAAQAKGCLVTDVNGHEVIDANNNYTSLIHGHASERVSEAAVSAIWRGASIGLPTESEIALAEELRERTGREQWRFCNSGSEAVMMALRGARRATGRDKIIRFQGSYHGTYDAVVGSTAGIARGVRDSVIVLPQGDLDAFTSAMSDHGASVAAVLIDLMPNRAGLNPAAPAFVHKVRDLTRRHNSLLIVDEIITFRLARGGFAARYDLDPDIITLGKVIGGGFPVGAIGGDADLLRAFRPAADDGISWGGTFSANPVSMDAGLAALSLYGELEINRLNAAGDALRRVIFETGLEVHGSGSLIRLIVREPTSEWWWRLYRRGLLISTNGLIALSTAMDDNVISQIAERIHAAMVTDAPAAAQSSE